MGSPRVTPPLLKYHPTLQNHVSSKAGAKRCGKSYQGTAGEEKKHGKERRGKRGGASERGHGGGSLGAWEQRGRRTEDRKDGVGLVGVGPGRRGTVAEGEVDQNRIENRIEKRRKGEGGKSGREDERVRDELEAELMNRSEREKEGKISHKQ
eukprot:767061-Hanusia_phi.AAC.1